MNHRRKALLIGKNGQVGHDILPHLEKISSVTSVDRAMLDLTRPDDIRQCVRSMNADVIVNAAAYTSVDQAESESAVAEAVNAKAPGVLAEEAARLGSLLVHYSTDYVFDGTKLDPYTEKDPVCPINTYGKTKADGEEAIRRTGCRHLIFRTSWVFSDRGNNFLLTVLRSARQRDELRIVDDQIGAPTSSQSLARATVEALQQILPEKKVADGSLGTYHMTASGETSWFGFATEIFQQASARLSIAAPRLYAIRSSDYKTAAKRPLNSRLDCSKVESNFGIVMPRWNDCLASTMLRLVRQNHSLLPAAR